MPYRRGEKYEEISEEKRNALESYYVPQLKAAQDANDNDRYGTIDDAYDAALAEAWAETVWKRTQEARAKARKFGIELPSYDDAYCWEQMDFWEEQGATAVPAKILTDVGFAEISRQIRRAR